MFPKPIDRCTVVALAEKGGDQSAAAAAIIVAVVLEVQEVDEHGDGCQDRLLNGRRVGGELDHVAAGIKRIGRTFCNLLKYVFSHIFVLVSLWTKRRDELTKINK